MSKNKRYRISIRVEKDFVRIVRAKSESQAIRMVKEAIAAKPLKITKSNFEKFPHTMEL